MKNILLFLTLIIIGFSSFYFSQLKDYYGENILGIKIETVDVESSTGNIDNEENLAINNGSSPDNTGEKNTEVKKIDREEAKNRIKILRKRFAIRGLIMAGDLHLENSRLTLALQKYLEAFKKNPEDEQIIGKLGEIYFEMKKFDSSYKNYKKIIDSSTLNKEKAVLAYIYSTDIDSSNIDEVLSEIDLFGMDEQEVFFYKNSINCLNDYHQCKLDFSNYFEENVELTSEKLSGVKDAIQNYRDFKVHELYYKNFLVSAELFKSELYPIAIKLGKDILVDKPDYKNVMKVIGKSYFELGKYEQAKVFLSKYYKIDKNDSDVTYLLGITNIKLHDYLLASIHLNNTLKNGYKNPINVKRRLIYTYYELGETEKMLAGFKNLVETEEEYLDPEDLGLSIYYHIINKENLIAKKFSKIGIELFPDEGIFYGYLGWMERDAGNLEIAEENLKKGLKLDSKNPLILLNLGQINYKNDSYMKAIIYFKKTIKIDRAGIFGENAQEWLDMIVEKKEEERRIKKELKEAKMRELENSNKPDNLEE